jgi:VIT1/CCC1 family predicted Fe2+/Mn2+ transporter
MAGGEYVSVSTQRDTEAAALERERRELATMPEAELDELTHIYEERGLSEHLARQVATELTEKNALRAHAETELQIDPDLLTSAWQAAGASFLAFAVGGVIPTIAILAPIEDWRVIICVAAVIVGLVVTGYASARLGHARPGPAVVRNVSVGILTMAITYFVGRITGGIV